MPASIYRVPFGLDGALYVMPKPSGEWLEDDLRHYSQMGVDGLVSLLTGEEMHELGLADQPRLCHDLGLDFRQHAIPDRGVPELAAFARLAREVHGQLGAGRSIAIHCRAGIGRSGMLACAVAMLAGLDCDAAIALVSEARGVDVPDTEEQAAFLKRLAITL